MEILGHPPHPVWVHMMGVPRHVSREGIFRKIGDYLGNTMEVDYQTISQKNLQFARVKILLNGLKRLLAKLSL